MMYASRKLWEWSSALLWPLFAVDIGVRYFKGVPLDAGDAVASLIGLAVVTFFYVKAARED